MKGGKEDKKRVIKLIARLSIAALNILNSF